MKILLTGSRGMVGNNIAKHSLAQNHEILTPTSAELNLLDSESVQNYIDTNKPDMVIHAAVLLAAFKPIWQSL